jgi:uncharacterized protein YdaU (DUF1376 family)
VSAFPYMRFYVGDYLGDTRHLTTLEHGAYLMLIFAYWQRGKPLPADDRKLAHIAGLTKPQWAKVKSHVIDFFEQKNAQIIHHRIEKEIEHMLAKSLKSQGAGRTSAQRRLDGRSTKPKTIDHSPEEDRSDKSELTSPAGDGENLFGDEPPDGGNRQEELDDQYTAPFESWWATYPNKQGKRAAAKAYAAAFKRLGGAKSGVDRVHSTLLHALRAQCSIWLRKGIVGKYIPHPATWLNRSSYSDDAVRAAMKEKQPNAPPAGLVELAPRMETRR